MAMKYAGFFLRGVVVGLGAFVLMGMIMAPIVYAIQNAIGAPLLIHLGWIAFICAWIGGCVWTVIFTKEAHLGAIMTGKKNRGFQFLDWLCGV